MSHTGTKMSTEFSLHFTLLKISHKRFSKFHNLVDSGCVKTWVCFSFCDIVLKIMFSIVWCKKCFHKSYRNVALLFLHWKYFHRISSKKFISKQNGNTKTPSSVKRLDSVILDCWLFIIFHRHNFLRSGQDRLGSDPEIIMLSRHFQKFLRESRKIGNMVVAFLLLFKVLRSVWCE